ncbi:MAG: NAD(P)-binding protein [Candidatus Micrarchaeota archaeon]
MLYRKILSKAKYHRIYEQIKLLVILLVAVLAYGTIGFMLLKKVDLVSAFVTTIESLEFLHQTEAIPHIRVFQASLVIFGGIFLWYAVWTFFEFILKGKLAKYITEVIHLMKAGRSKNHVVICGGGRVGSTLAKMLSAKNSVVLIEKDNATASTLRAAGLTVISGDALNEEILREANIENARALVATISSGEKNALLILTAKQINPHLEIYARTEDERHVKKLKSLGVKQVIMPELAGAKELYAALK